MHFPLLLLLTHVAALVEGKPKGTRSRDDFVLLGRRRQEVKSFGRTSIFDDFNYYVSQNAADWSKARADCEDIFAPYGHLLTLETEPEWKYILKELDDYGSGFIYWTAGVCDKSKSFRWFSSKGEQLPSWAPWGPNEPPKKLTPSLRVIIWHGNIFNGHWATDDKKSELRYICEARESAPPPPEDTTPLTDPITGEADDPIVGEESTTMEIETTKEGVLADVDIAVIADDDELSKDPNDPRSWLSWYKMGSLIVHGNSPTSMRVSVTWGDSEQVSSGYNYKDRGMELSTLNRWNDKMFSCDDKTGILYRLAHENGKLIAVPWLLLPDGNPNGKGSSGVQKPIFFNSSRSTHSSMKGFKCEWATVKGSSLYVGSTGVTLPKNNENGKYVRKIKRNGLVTVVDWRKHYDAMAKALNISSPGYVTHEAGLWDDTLKKWIFAPRKVSEEAWDKDKDVNKCSNQFLVADEEFTNIEVHTVGEVNPTRGFSSIQVVPFEDLATTATVIVALKSMELQEPRTLETYVMAFDLKGKILYPETKIDDHKYEGIEII